MPSSSAYSDTEKDSSIANYKEPVVELHALDAIPESEKEAAIDTVAAAGECFLFIF